MKNSPAPWAEKHRIKEGEWESPEGSLYGAFILDRNGERMTVISSGGDPDIWEKCGFTLPVFEHVSVSLQKRCATWDEMCWIKKIFWNPSECVIQYHPPAHEYVNTHKYCLHLWKPLDFEFPLPPKGAMTI